jgi:outer membrane receptor for ferrienterochelin and colicin
LVLGLGAPTLAAAQSAREVVVLDRAGGKAVAGAKVALSNPETGFSASGVTDANGKLLFPVLTPAGAYVASVTPGSGAAISSSPIRLRSNFTRSVTLLRDTAPIEQITVTGNRVLNNLNFTNAEVSGSLSAEDLASLPVEGRDLATVLYRLPNVTQSTGFFNEAPSISINGANGLFTQYLVDGLDNNENFLGGQKFPTPVGMIRDVTVLANSYSVEFGRTANGIVNVTTKGGSNHFEFEPFFLWRPGNSIDASQDFSSRDLSGNAVLNGFKRFQGGIAAGGPIVRDQTFFFVDLETTRDDKDNRLTVPALGVNETIKGENRLDYLTLRLDQTWNEDWSSTLRVNRGDVEIERQGGGLEGGLTFPSAGDVQDRESNLTAFTTRYSGGRFSYVGELQYATFDWNFGDAKVDGPQATLLGPDGSPLGVIGNNGFFFDLDERTIQTKQKFTVNFDHWRLNTGVDYMKADFELTGGGNPAGNYTVMLNNAQLAAVRAANRGAALGVNDIPADVQVVNYGVELRPARFGTDQTLLGLWTQAQIDFTEKLTANFGLRYDYDDLTKFGTGDADDDNISPRFGFNYRLSDTRVIRGGAGIFYEKLPYVVISDAFQRNADTAGFRQQLAQLVALGRLPADTDIDRVVRNGNLTVNPPAPVFLQGPTGAQLAGQGNNLTASERQIINPFGYNNPYSVQFSLGYQQAFADQWLLEANLIYNRGHDLVRLIDVNSPAPFAGITAQQAATLPPDQLQALVRTQAQADVTRPTQPPPGGANSILISDTGGRSEYKALTLGVTKERGDDFYGARVAYTLSRLENNTDDINFRAQDANNFGNEFAPSLNDRKHVVSAILYLYPLQDLSLSLAGLYQSGQPINFGPDAALFGTTDLNGDGRSFTNQFTGNPDRAPGRGRNSGRLSSTTTFDLAAQYLLPMFNDGKLELSVDVFNVFNEVNLSGYAVNATASNQFQVAGRPFLTRSSDRPRTFQFGARYLF